MVNEDDCDRSTGDVRAQLQASGRAPSRDAVSEASDESFPASDPPARSGMRVGPPDRRYSATVAPVKV